MRGQKGMQTFRKQLRRTVPELLKLKSAALRFQKLPCRVSRVPGIPLLRYGKKTWMPEAKPDPVFLSLEVKAAGSLFPE